MKNNKQKTILLLGTHGQENWGDEILLETFLQSLGQEHNYLVNSYNPNQTEFRFSKTFDKNKIAELDPKIRDQNSLKYNLKAFHTTKEILKLPLRIWQSDLVFFAGGSILKELYASYGRWVYSTLFMILGIVTFSKFIAQKTVVTSNIGVGPVKTKFGRFLVKLILSQVNIISLRDEASKKIVLDSGISEIKVQVVPDIVFIRTPKSLATMGIESAENDDNVTESDSIIAEKSGIVAENLDSPFNKKVDQSPLFRGVTESRGMSSANKEIVIGLNLNKDIAKPEMWPSLLENVALSLKQIQSEALALKNQTVARSPLFRGVTESRGMSDFVEIDETQTIKAREEDLEVSARVEHPIHFLGIPMQIGFSTHHDLLILNDFSKVNPTLNLDVIKPETSAHLAEIISKCNFIISERLHAIIIATVLGVPSIPLIYDPKVASLADYLGLSDYAIDINKPFSPEDLTDKILALQTNFTSVKSNLQAKYQSLNKIDADYFEELKTNLNLK